MAEQNQKPLTPDRVMQFAWGYTMPLIIETAIEHGVFNALDAGPMTVRQVSEKTGASARGLRAIMDALLGVELLKRDGERYSLSPESAAFLVKGKPGYQGGIYHHISKQLIPKWLQLSSIVKTGKPAMAVNDEDTGAKFFEKFVEDIFPMSYGIAKALGEHLKLGSATGTVKVLDIAAGSGVWGIALAQQSKQVRVAAVDWHDVIPVTKRIVARHKLESQFSYVEGDINSVDLGTGYQIATLGHILHSEGVERSKRLIKRVHDALAPGGTIAIGEFLRNDDELGPAMAMIFAVNMLVNTDVGDTFSFATIRTWLGEAGFTDARTMQGPGVSPLVLATKRA